MHFIASDGEIRSYFAMIAIKSVQTPHGPSSMTFSKLD